MASLFDELNRLHAAGKSVADHEDALFEQFGRTLSVLVADTVGMTKATQQRGIIHFLGKVARARARALPIVEQHGGFDVRYMADNFIAMFDQPADAVEAALALHEAFERDPILITETQTYELCIGIGFGTLIYSSALEGYFGDEMNLASKLGEDLARGKETLLTEPAYNELPAATRRDFYQIDPRDPSFKERVYRQNTRGN